MHEVLNQNLFFIEEQVGLLRAANNYDIYNPRTQELVMTCKEENLGTLTKITRFTPFKTQSSFCIVVRSQEGDTLFTVKRGTAVAAHLTAIEVLNPEGEVLAKFKQQKQLKTSFDVLDATDQVIYTINKPKEKENEFVFWQSDQNLANISKKWAGAGKELLTTADNYLLQIMVTVPPDAPVRRVILAAVLCIDMVLYE
jgi:uncharacterized protein YxjI